jgi:predicted Zn finger-like uncharacterized protein
MILTCPACGTQYLVKDGAIPAAGRQVRCASCGHSWHQDPEGGEQAATAPVAQPEGQRSHAEQETAERPEDVGENEYRPETVEPEAEPVGGPAYDTASDEPVDAAPTEPDPPQTDAAGLIADESSGGTDAAWSMEDDFGPFASREPDEPRRRSGMIAFAVLLLLIAAAAAAFWMLAPSEWHQRLGLAQADGETPLQLMMTHSDRRQLASGNEMLSIAGRVINPTDDPQPVPPIRAELRNSSGQLVYRWTIPPPARTLAPGASASFNSAELDVPAGGDELTVSLGEPRA